VKEKPRNSESDAQARANGNRFSLAVLLPLVLLAVLVVVVGSWLANNGNPKDKKSVSDRPKDKEQAERFASKDKKKRTRKAERVHRRSQGIAAGIHQRPWHEIQTGATRQVLEGRRKWKTWRRNG